MKYRSTLVYLLAAVVLVGVYLFETRRDEKKEVAEDEAKRLFQIEARQLDLITLKRGGSSIVLRKSGLTGRGSWEITAPFSAGTDRFELTRLLDRLAELKSLRLISESADDLSPFGLDKPALLVAFKAGEGEGSLSLGAKSPIENAFYAAKDQGKRVVLIGAEDRDGLDRSLFDLRDKRLFTLEADRANRLVIERESGTWIFLKKEGKWSLEGREDLKVDQENLESLIRRTTWLEASSFEKESAQDLTPYGLERPKARISLSDGETTEEISFGDPVKGEKEERDLAKMGGRPQIITVEKRFLKGLPKSMEDLRKKEDQKKPEAKE